MAPHYCRGMCKPCYGKHLRTSNPDFAERQRENRRQWGLKNPSKVKTSQAGYVRRNRLKRYGLDEAEYQQMVDKQGNLCRICQNPQDPRFGELYIDHCHTTQDVRGLLCRDCNYGLGVFKDDPRRLHRAALYLEKKLND